jgi:hypothetical protein
MCEVEAFVSEPEVVNVIRVILPNSTNFELICREDEKMDERKIWLLGKIVVKNVYVKRMGSEEEYYTILEVWV